MCLCDEHIGLSWWLLLIASISVQSSLSSFPPHFISTSFTSSPPIPPPLQQPKPVDVISEDPDLDVGVNYSAANTHDDIIDLTKPSLQSEHTSGLNFIPQEGEGLFSFPSDVGSTFPSWSLLANLLNSESSNHNTAPQESSPLPSSPPPQEVQQGHHGCYGNTVSGGASARNMWAIPAPRTLITELDQGGQAYDSHR